MKDSKIVGALCHRIDACRSDLHNACEEQTFQEVLFAFSIFLLPSDIALVQYTPVFTPLDPYDLLASLRTTFNSRSILRSIIAP